MLYFLTASLSAELVHTSNCTTTTSATSLAAADATLIRLVPAPALSRLNLSTVISVEEEDVLDAKRIVLRPLAAHLLARLALARLNLSALSVESVVERDANDAVVITNHPPAAHRLVARPPARRNRLKLLPLSIDLLC